MFLEAENIHILNRDEAPVIFSRLGIKPGMKVLAVGSGSREFIRDLSDVDLPENTGIEYTDIDDDELSGLTFEDSLFDVVISYTFMTASIFYEKAFSEMIRVCKKDGIIASINISSFDKIIHESGNSKRPDYMKRFDELSSKLSRALENEGFERSGTAGIYPHRVPSFMEKKGLSDIKVYPMGTFFSLSNNALGEDDRKRFIELSYKTETKRIDNISSFPGLDAYIEKEEVSEYRELLLKRKEHLLSVIDENHEWEYDGALYFMVEGKNSKKSQVSSDSASGDYAVYRKSKYKSSKPLETVQKIKDILKGIGITTTVTYFPSGVDGIYSNRICIENTSIGQNGKGTTPEYALASGYAEFMERLQTGHLFEIETKDSSYFSRHEMSEKGGELLRASFSMLYKIPAFVIDTENILSQWEEALSQGVSPFYRDGKFKAFPFTTLDGEKTCYMPEFFLKGFPFTNGSCAGNNKEEALVQGLSEIMERYASRLIIKDKLTPPDIPEDVIAGIPELFEILSELRNQSDMEIKIFDASLGKGLPVVGAVMIDKKNKRQTMRFGAHPRFEVALERTLTELMQGGSTQKMQNMVPVGVENEPYVDAALNLFNSVKGGYGFTSMRMFSGKPDWEYVPFKEAPVTNTELLKFLADKAKELNWDVYIRDCNFYGFETIHVYVPQASMIMDLGKISITQYLMKLRYAHILRSFASYDIEKQEKALQAMSLVNGFMIHDSLDHITGIGFNANLFGRKIDYKLLQALFDIKSQNFERAANYLLLYRMVNEEFWVLYELVKAKTMKEAIPDIDENIDGYLSALCSPNSLKKAREIINDPYSVLPSCTYPDCADCRRKDSCDTNYVQSQCGSGSF